MKCKQIWLPLLAIITFSLGNHLFSRQASLVVLPAGNEKSRSIEVDNPACDTPSAQPRYVSMGTVKTDSASGYIEPIAGVSSYLVVISTSSNLSFVPATGGSYAVGSTAGNGKVVKAGTGTSFTATGLIANSNYYVYVFSMNTNCPGGTVYRSFNPAAVMVHTAGAGSGN